MPDDGRGDRECARYTGRDEHRPRHKTECDMLFVIDLIHKPSLSIFVAIARALKDMILGFR